MEDNRGGWRRLKVDRKKKEGMAISQFTGIMFHIHYWGQVGGFI
jgi:hypothetical protein